MGSDRKNIKTNSETFEDLNEIRQELDLEWTPFLQTAADAIRIVHLEEEEEQDSEEELTFSDIERIIKREHEYTRGKIPEETAAELSERF